MARQVITFARVSCISVRCQFAGKDAQLFLARDIKGMCGSSAKISKLPMTSLRKQPVSSRRVFLQMREPDMKGRNFPLSRRFLLRLALHTNPHLLCVVRGAVERCAEVFGFSAECGTSIPRAVAESLTTIIR